MRTLVWGMVIACAFALALALTTGTRADASEAPDLVPTAEPPATQVEGAVLDRDGHGVDGATVIARPVGLAVASFETLTDRRGRFHLDGLPPGSYWFIAFHPDHPAGSSPAIPVVGHVEIAIHLDEEPASA